MPKYVTATKRCTDPLKVTPGQRVVITARQAGSARHHCSWRLAGLEMDGAVHREGGEPSELAGIPIDHRHQDFVEEVAADARGRRRGL